MTSNTWTFERIEALRALWKTGKTVVMIAGELGVSTGAVIGKVHRLGLPVRKGETRRDPKAPRQGKSGAKPGTRPYIRKRVIRPMISPSASPVVRQEVSIPEPVSRQLTIIQLTEAVCHWPENKRYCGHEVQEGSVYCPHHHQRAYKPRQERQQRRAA